MHDHDHDHHDHGHGHMHDDFDDDLWCGNGKMKWNDIWIDKWLENEWKYD